MPTMAQALSGLGARTFGAAARSVLERAPQADLDARDTDYIRETLPGLWMLASLYFRAEVRGLHHITPEGPVLLVGNHSGGMMAPDLPIMLALPFGLMPGVFGHIPLPSKITIQVLPKIELRERFGEDPDVEEIYDEVIARMPDVLTSLAEDRRLPVIG